MLVFKRKTTKNLYKFHGGAILSILSILKIKCSLDVSENDSVREDVKKKN
jgi:hypothetical protein